MNSRPIVLRLVSGSVTPASAVRKRSRASDGVQPRAGRRDEVLLHLLALARAQQPVVDEHARQPVADRALDERGRHRGVDATGQPADRPPVADLLPDRRDRLLDDRGDRPARGDPGDVVQEPAQHLLAVRGVPDLRVVLHAGQPPLPVFERRDRRALRRRRHREALGRPDDRVAVAHPHRVPRRQALVQGPGVVGDGQLGAAVLARPVRRDLAAERLRHRLEAVAEARAPARPR